MLSRSTLGSGKLGSAKALWALKRARAERFLAQELLEERLAK